MMLSTRLNSSAVNRIDMNQTEPRVPGLVGYPARQLTLLYPTTRQTAFGRRTGLSFALQAGNLWELLFAVIQSFRPEAL